MNNKQKDIKKYYETLDLTKVKNPKNIHDELLYQLFKNPREDRKRMPTYSNVEKNAIHQADILYLPNDSGYKYCLTVVDVGSKLCDVEPLKNRTAKDTLKALQDVYKRKVLTMPETLKVDDGSEFKGEFSKWCKSNLNFVVAQPGRHRSIALVEARNRAIGTYLIKRQVAEELLTGEQSNEWLKWLPKFIKELNKRYEVKKIVINESFEMKTDDKKQMLQIGDLVRFKLDRPINPVNGKPVKPTKFRGSDIKFSLKPTKIKAIKMSPDTLPLYALEGQKAYYTIDQLLPIVETPNLPPKTVQEKFIVDEIVGKKKVKNVVKYIVKFKGEKNNKLVDADILIKDIPELVNEFERNNKKKEKKSK